MQEYNDSVVIKGVNVLFFYSSWSKSCQINEEIISKLSKNFHIIKINTTKYYNMKTKFKINKIPTYIYYNNGTFTIYNGPINYNSIYNWLIKR